MGDWFDDERKNPFFFGLDALSNPAPRNWLNDLVKSPAPRPPSPYSSLINALSPPPLSVEKKSLGGLLGLASPPQALPADTNALGGLFSLAPPSSFLGSLAP